MARRPRMTMLALMLSTPLAGAAGPAAAKAARSARPIVTGGDSHRVGVGNMLESMAPDQQGKPGYEGYLRPDTVTIAERLSAAGYRTLMSGKWHLGVAPEQDPHARGFSTASPCCNAATTISAGGFRPIRRSRKNRVGAEDGDPRRDGRPARPGGGPRDRGAEGEPRAGRCRDRLPVRQWRGGTRYAATRRAGAAGADGHVTYGACWAQAATAPSWRFKTLATEGGLHKPAFVSGRGIGRTGSIGRAYVNVADIVPTLLDMAGVTVTPGRFAGRRVRPIDGPSGTGFLKTGALVYPADRAVGSELFGSRSLGRGDRKLTDLGDGRWRLFDLATNPGETADLASREPKRMDVMLAAWDAYAKDVGVVLPDPPLHPNPPKERE